MPEVPERLYFAYGSNINLDQMERRCPNAEVVGPVTLNGYRLLFRGGYPNHGVATIAPDPTKQVKGLLWRLTPECEQSLDTITRASRISMARKPSLLWIRLGTAIPSWPTS